MHGPQGILVRGVVDDGPGDTVYQVHCRQRFGPVCGLCDHTHQIRVEILILHVPVGQHISLRADVLCMIQNSVVIYTQLMRIRTYTVVQACRLFSFVITNNVHTFCKPKEA